MLREIPSIGYRIRKLLLNMVGEKQGVVFQSAGIYVQQETKAQRN